MRVPLFPFGQWAPCAGKGTERSKVGGGNAVTFRKRKCKIGIIWSATVWVIDLGSIHRSVFIPPIVNDRAK